MRTSRSLAPAALFAAALPLRADTPAEGFALFEEPLPLPVAEDPFGLGFDTYGSTWTLSSGQVVTFDGLEVLRLTAQGLTVDVLATFGAPAFPAFVRVDPTESFALVAESSEGNVYRVELDGTGATLLADLELPYDAAFEHAGSAIVSAATCGFGCGNELVRLDTTTGAWTAVATVSGPSGPVATSPAGDLFYGSIPSGLSGSSSVLRFPAAALAGSAPLTEADADVVSTGYAGASALAYDPEAGHLYVAENDGVTGAGAVRRVGHSAQTDEVLVDGTPYWWISELQVVPGGPGALLPYQPPGGSALVYSSTEFSQGKTARHTLRPARPVSTATGAGTSGVGLVEYELTHAPPHGMAVVIWSDVADFSLPEVELGPAALSPPWVTGFSLTSLMWISEPLPIDAQGRAGFAFQNYAGVTGTTAFQALCADAAGEIVGTSTHGIY